METTAGLLEMQGRGPALPTTIWYGERGIVNSIVNHVSGQEDAGETVARLLDAVAWADGGKPSWISRIAQVNLIVEIGLADFGNPDLVIVCRTTGDQRPHCVFLEAKAICYQFSMGSNSSGMSPGFNSSINGQLSLKYRFAKALANSLSTKDEIVEPEALFAAYKEQLRDYSHKPRHLRKPEILQILSYLGLMSLPEERFCYVALTWDDAEHAFFADSDVAKADGLPLLLDEAGKDIYDVMKPRIGWLGYANLEEALGLRANGEYAQACSGMFARSAPTHKDYGRLRAAAAMPEYDSAFLEELFGRFREACGQHTKFFWKQHTGSYSLGIAGKTLAKLMPEGDLVFVGVRDDCGSGLGRTELPVEKTVQSVCFRGVVLKPDSDYIDLDLYLQRLLAVFSEMSGQTSS